MPGRSATAATVAAKRGTPPGRRVSLWRIPRTRSLLALTVLGAVGGGLLLAARLFTDILWFDEVGQVDVFWTSLKWKALTAACVGFGTAGFVLGNLALAERALARAGHATGAGVPASLWQNRRLLRPAIALSCGVLAIALRRPDSWQLLLLWTKRSAFGVTDPLFHRDVGFFVFSLPLYRELASWLLQTVALGGVAALASYAAAGAFRAGRRREALRAARAQLLALTAALLAVLAWRLRLERYELVLPHDSRAAGATYTDVLVRLPLLQALFVLAIAGIALSAYWSLRRRVPLIVAGVLALVAAIGILAKGELPAVIQRFAVQPQALTRERTHVAHAIEFTRRAYGLDRVDAGTLDPAAQLSRRELAAERATVENVALWDEDVLLPALDELQSIDRYHEFPSLSVDRYMIDGKPQVVSVAARQLSIRRLGSEHRSWATDRFAYTHGYGVLAVRGGHADRGRYPVIVQQGMDAERNPLGVQEPRIYFGQQPGNTPPYVVLNTHRAEVDAPLPGDRGPDYHYAGSGGIALSDLPRRIAFAARFHDLDLLLTQTVSDRSRIVLHRDIGERLRSLAPFLRWDDEPQTAVIDGRVQFIVDGYTTSDSYPYSAPVRFGREEVNYVRASARATVDAYSGAVRIYAEPGDPILSAWRAVYPGLFLDLARMPAGLRAHLLYPRLLFDAQADVYQTYHADDATAFWNGSDAWARALQLAGPVENAGEIRFPDAERQLDGDAESRVRRTWRLRPQYGLVRLPGDERERFVLATPFTPRGRENLVAYLAGSLGPDGRPQLKLLTLPRDRLTAGPTQATRRILSSAGVVRRLQLLNRESRDLGHSGITRTVLGAPRVVPIGDTLVHLQPLFLSTGGEGVPRLQLVAAFANGRVGYGRTVKAALRSVTAG